MSNPPPKLYFALLITRKDGSQFLATGGKGAPTALFHRRVDAKAFRRELAADHVGIPSKVIPVRQTIEIHTPGKKGAK